MGDHGIEVDPPCAPGADLLQRAALFHSLDFDQTLRLSAICKSERRPDGALILEQDSLGQALYLLQEGTAAVRRRDPSTGAVHELARLGPAEMFGEMSLVDDRLVSADVVAVGPVSLVVLPRREFEALLARDDKLAARIYRCFCAALAERLRKTNARLAGHP
jgi:CRP-like cAMP-binding protein